MLLPKVKLKTVVSFPAAVYGGTGLAVTQSNGIFTFNLDFSELAPISTIATALRPTTYAALWESTQNTYRRINIPDLQTAIGGGGAGGIPEAPTDGVLYARQNAAWAQAVKIGGDTMTGTLTISNVPAGPIFQLYGAVGNNNDIYGSKTTGQRWIIRPGNASAESGGNAGSDLDIIAWNDAGTVPTYTLTINRASGLATVKGDPTAALGIVTKQYSDTKLALAGGTMTGALTLNANPAVPLGAATKQYVDGAVGGGLPEAPNDGALYGRQSLAWAKAVKLGGDTMTGPLILNADPAVPLGAVTKQYADAAPGFGGVRYDIVQALTTPQREQARTNIAAAPFDAMAYSGIQLNGAMDVSEERGQNGTTTNGTYALDGWMLGRSGTMAVTARQLNAATLSGLPNILTVTVGTAQASLGSSDVLWVRHSIEGYRMARLGFGTANAQPITIGFLTAHARAGLYTGSAINGAATRGYAFSYNQLVANAWEYKTITIPGDVTGSWPATNNEGMIVTLLMAAGSAYMMATGAWVTTPVYGGLGQVNGVAAVTDVFRCTGFFVMPGNEAPPAFRVPLIQRSFDQEVLQTRRLYYAIAPNLANAEHIGGGMSSNVQGYYPLAVQKMRLAPSMSVSAASDWNNNPFGAGSSIQPGTSVQFADITPYGCRMGITSLTTAAVAGVLSILDAATVNARINFDARF